MKGRLCMTCTSSLSCYTEHLKQREISWRDSIESKFHIPTLFKSQFNVEKCIFIKCGSRGPSPECEEDSIAEEVHERVIGSNKWYIGPQRPWRFRWSPSSQEPECIWQHVHHYLLSLRCTSDTAPQRWASSRKVLLLRLTPAHQPHASAPPVGAVQLPQMWLELRWAAGSDASPLPEHRVTDVHGWPARECEPKHSRD